MITQCEHGCGSLVGHMAMALHGFPLAVCLCLVMPATGHAANAI